MTKRKILAVIMCLALTVSAALSGCGQTTSQSSGQSQSSSSSAAGSESQAESSEVSSQPETDGTLENGIVFDDQVVKYYIKDAEAMSQGAFRKPFIVNGKNTLCPPA